MPARRVPAGPKVSPGSVAANPPAPSAERPAPANPLAPALASSPTATIFYLVSRFEGVEAVELASPDGSLIHTLAADRHKTAAKFAKQTGCSPTTHEVRTVEVSLFGGGNGAGG